MKIRGKADFIAAIDQFDIQTEYAVIKPNWVSNLEGEFTEAEVLAWLLEALPRQKKIVVEGYTPWRGLVYQPKREGDELKVDLAGSRENRDFYRQMDRVFLQETGTGKVLQSYEAEYLNITECFWAGECVPGEKMLQEIQTRGYEFNHPDFASYMPSRLYDIRHDATLISLAKIKRSASPVVGCASTIKNMFGLLPAPSRARYHMGDDMEGLAEALEDTFFLYALTFQNSLWLAEGIRSIALHPYTPQKTVKKGLNHLFLGRDPISVTLDSAKIVDMDPFVSPFFRDIERISKELDLFPQD